MKSPNASNSNTMLHDWSPTASQLEELTQFLTSVLELKINLEQHTLIFFSQRNEF